MLNSIDFFKNSELIDSKDFDSYLSNYLKNYTDFKKEYFFQLTNKELTCKYFAKLTGNENLGVVITTLSLKEVDIFKIFENEFLDFEILKIIESFKFKEFDVYVLGYIKINCPYFYIANSLDYEGLLPEIDDNIKKLTINQKYDIILQISKSLNKIHDLGFIYNVNADSFYGLITIENEIPFVTFTDFSNTRLNSIEKKFSNFVFIPPESLKKMQGTLKIKKDYIINVNYDYWCLGIFIFSILYPNKYIPSLSNFIADDELADNSNFYIENVYIPYKNDNDIDYRIIKLLDNLLKFNPKKRKLVIDSKLIFELSVPKFTIPIVISNRIINNINFCNISSSVLLNFSLLSRT